MKHTATKMVLALVLACCLLFGTAGAVFAQQSHKGELNQLLTDVKDLMNKYGPEIPQEVLDGTDRGTFRSYEPTENGYYVAIGENSTMGDNSYVSLLMKDLGLTGKNLAERDLMLEQVSEKILAVYAADIQKAELITLNFSVNTFARMAVNEVLDKDNEYLDWGKYVPAEGVAEIKETLAQLKSYLVSAGVSGSIPTLGPKVDALVAAFECIAYGTIAYAETLPLVLDEIHAMNPNARIIIVGMDNPFEGTTISLSDSEVMELGTYVSYLIDMTDDCAQAATLERTYVTFVSASGAANANDNTNLSENKVITDYLRSVKEDAIPNAEGQAYIKDRIKASFRKLGDVNGDGVVNYNDALLVLRASVKLASLDEEAKLVGDVDGTAGLSYNDALKILRASIKLDTLR